MIGRAASSACALYFFIQGLCASSWAARIPAIAQELDLTDAMLGSVLVCAPLASLCAMPLAGLLVARFGARAVLRLGVVYQALGVFAIGWAPTTFALTAALLAYGAANTLVQISVNAQAVLTERADGVSRMASYHGLWSIGGFVGAAIAATMTSQGVAPSTHVSVVLVVVLVLYALGYRHLIDDTPLPSANTAWGQRPNRTLVTLGLLACAAMFCETAMFDWSGMYLHRVALSSGAVSAFAYAAMMAAMAIGRFAADICVTRLGLTRTLRLGSSTAFMGLAAAVLWPSPALTSCSFVLVGLGLSPIVPLLMGCVGRLEGMPTGMALAWASTIGFTGAMAAPPVIGWLSHGVGLRLAFGVPVLLAFVLSVRLRTAPGPKRRMAKTSAIG